jgi:hypothetical protein
MSHLADRGSLASPRYHYSRTLGDRPDDSRTVLKGNTVGSESIRINELFASANTGASEGSFGVIGGR